MPKDNWFLGETWLSKVVKNAPSPALAALQILAVGGTLLANWKPPVPQSKPKCKPSRQKAFSCLPPGGVMGWPWVHTNFSAFITYDFCFPGNIREPQVASTAHQMGESSELEGQPQKLHMLQARFYFKQNRFKYPCGHSTLLKMNELSKVILGELSSGKQVLVMP